MCGPALGGASCQLNGCAGTQSDGRPQCQGRFKWCWCKPNVFTRGFCPIPTEPCTSSTCNNNNDWEYYHTCSLSSSLGCACVPGSIQDSPDYSSAWSYILYRDSNCQDGPLPNVGYNGNGLVYSAFSGFNSICVPYGLPSNYAVNVLDHDNQILYTFTSANAGCPGDVSGRGGCFSNPAMMAVSVNN